MTVGRVTVVGVGDPAPDFTLPSTQGAISLSDYRGRPVVLVFYPGDGTAVCSRQLNSYNDDLARFDQLDAQVLAISAQDLDSHQAFADEHGFKFPLLADVDQAVATAYGILGPMGFPRRSTFIIDGKGVIRYAHRAIAGLTFRPAAELVAVVEAL